MDKEGGLLHRTATLPYKYLLDLTNYTGMVEKLTYELQ